MLVTMLQLDGFEIAGQAGDGAEAVRTVLATRPDAVVMDVRMPGSDGISALRQIRTALPDLAVIVYSAYVDSATADAARAAGARLCLGKVEGLLTLERELAAISLELDAAR